MIWDISLGDAQRPSGIEAAMPSITPGPSDFMAAVTLSVLVGPTATALTRTLPSANSAAQYRVSENVNVTRLVRQPRYVVEIGEVREQEPGCAPCLQDGLHHPLASFGVSSRDQYLGALLGE